MSFLSRLLAPRPDPREQLRPLWHRVVALSREPHWYAREGVADNVPGRFDMIAAVLALVLLRMEREPSLAASSALLAELFVEDMDGQLRESGVGDLMVGKHIGKLLSGLGGRLGAFREGLVAGDEGALAQVAQRNVTLVEGADPALLAAALRRLHLEIDALPAEDLLAARLPA
jgi:cytochrome b pre-mRNA-processing protein 3